MSTTALISQRRPPAYKPIHALSNSAAFRLAMASRAVYVAKMVDARP